MSFDAETRARALLWCDRHCCLCKRSCGADIDVYPIVAPTDDDPEEIDNAIPLCPDCRAAVVDRARSRPLPTEHHVHEMKTRREQVYDEHTRHLVPPVSYELTQAAPDGGSRRFPDVGFVLSHLGDSLPVRVRVRMTADPPDSGFRAPSRHYDGTAPWHLNPRSTIHAHFEMPEGYRPPSEPFPVRLEVSIVDAHEREHPHLPVRFTYVPHGNYWFREP